MASSRAAILVIVGTVLVLAAGTAGVAGVGSRHEPPSSERVTPTYRAGHGTLSRAVTLAGRMQWKPEPILTPGIASGVLTSSNLARTRSVAEGAVLFTVDLEPIVAVRSDVPFFRDLAVGDQGSDVAALVAFLQRQGKLTGRLRRTDLFDGRVGAAVRGWQVSVGALPTGSVAQESVVAVPRLPAVLSTTIPVGSTLGGDPFIEQWSSDVRFTVDVGGDLSDVVEEGTHADVSVGGHHYPARVDELSPEEGASGALPSEGVLATLGRADRDRQRSLCGDLCAMPATGTTRVTEVRLQLVPPVAGSMVPTSAIGVDAAGASYVVLAPSGKHRPVHVLAQDGGRAVIRGISPGTTVRALAAA